MLSSGLFGDFDIFALKPRQFGQRFGFLIVDYATDRQFCLNLMQQSWDGAISIDPVPFLGHIVTRIDPTFLVAGEVLVFNIYFGPMHGLQQQRLQTENMQDYTSYGVFVAKTDDATINSAFLKVLLPSVNLKIELQKVLNRETDLDRVMNQLHTFIGTCQEIVFFDQNLVALLDGLMHHESTLRNAIIFRQGEHYMARHVLKIMHDGEEQRVAFLVNGNDFRVERSVSDRQPKLKILRLNFNLERTETQFRIQSRAAFDRFGSAEKPLPSILATLCDL